MENINDLNADTKVKIKDRHRLGFYLQKLVSTPRDKHF